MKSSLRKVLEKHNEEQWVRMHMPGHKGRFPDFLELNTIAPFDYTELSETDSLFEASGVLKQLEKRITDLYQTAGSFISCGGATLAIQTMLALYLKEGDGILIGRGCHGSAVSAMALLGITPYWIWPSETSDLHGQPKIKDIETALKQEKEIKAVYLTSPNYFGELADLKGIADLCRDHKIPLLVDSAHGAHFPFIGLENPIALGANACAESAHKTLPALTGSAFLHLGDTHVISNVKETMRLFGSTSPSYLMMLSIEYAIDFLENEEKNSYEQFVKQIQALHHELENFGYLLPQNLIDPMRMVLSANQLGYNGEEFYRYLMENKIEPEMLLGDFVVLIPTPMNTKEEMERLKKVLLSIKGRKTNQKELFLKKALKLPKPEKILNPREALFLEKEEIKVENSIDRVSGMFSTPCPPGIPIVVPGEKIDKKTAEVLKLYGVLNIKVVK